MADRLATIPALDMRHLPAPVSATLLAYHQHLAERNALDFPDLLYRTRAMLALLPEKRAKWSARFQWIQMDEVQDTHVSEYGNELTNRAALARNLDFLSTDDASIPILTVHQSKGQRAFPMDHPLRPYHRVWQSRKSRFSDAPQPCSLRP
jgi:superfamily I DNA/RNA helicase